MEYWKNGILGKSKRQKDDKTKSFKYFAFWLSHYSIVPLFHYSN